MTSGHYEVKFYALTKTQSPASSINAIGVNLPGPGRNLGRLYDWLGQKFESSLGKMLFRTGHGPVNIARKLKALQETQLAKGSKGQVADMLDSRRSDMCKISRYCRKLVKYSRFVLTRFGKQQG